MDNNKVENFSKKDPNTLYKIGKALKKAAGAGLDNASKISAAEKLIMAFPTPSKLIQYLKSTYKWYDHLYPWSNKVDRTIKKLQKIPEDNKSLYRSVVYAFCNTGLGLATIYDVVPSARSFFKGIWGLGKEVKGISKDIDNLNMEDDDMNFSNKKQFAESEDKSAERKSFFKKVGHWFKTKGEAIAKNEAVKWIKDNPAKATFIGVSTATVISFLAINGKIGALKERLKNTDDPEERAAINKKLSKLKIYLTAMVIGTATTGALAGRSYLKDKGKLGFKKWDDKSFSYDFEDEVGEGEDAEDENDSGDDAAPTDAEDPAPKVDTEEKDFDYDFEDEDTEDDEDKGDETPAEVTPVEDDPESAKKVEDIKDAEVAMGPGKLAEFSKNLRRFCSDPTNVELRRSVLSQFSEAMDEAVYDKHFADFDQFAEDQTQPAAQSAPAPAVVPPAPAPAPAGAPVAPAPAAEPAPAPADPNAAPAPAPAAPVAEGAPADPNAAGAPVAPAPADGAAPADPNAAAPADPNAAPAEGQPAQGDGTNESDIVIDKREVQANFSVQDESYGSRMARLARA